MFTWIIQRSPSSVSTKQLKSNKIIRQQESLYIANYVNKPQIFLIDAQFDLAQIIILKHYRFYSFC